MVCIEDDFILETDLISRHRCPVKVRPGFTLGMIQPPHNHKKNMIASASINTDHDISVRAANVFPSRTSNKHLRRSAESSRSAKTTFGKTRGKQGTGTKNVG